MQELPLFSQIVFYVLIALIGLYVVLIEVWQIKVLRGETMSNPDGSVDDWHEQKSHYGIALADVLLACPAGFISIVLTFFYPRWGFYLLALVSFWLVWTNTMTTATACALKNQP